MDDDDLFCLGCFRTLDEIAVWGELTDAEKEPIWIALDQRRNRQS
jgi:predicted Fe-S protein YdhL (DUF1289 family)